MRGKQAYETFVDEFIGLIPAYAGKTNTVRTLCVWKRAHPRVCGENPRRFGFLSQPQGSSPRMRGKHPHHGPAPGTFRLIPAYAGKTASRMYAGACLRAHPRVCGENMSPHFFNSSGVGSSPRMRGKRALRAHVSGRDGLIPAYAGKTNSPKTQ